MNKRWRSRRLYKEVKDNEMGCFKKKELNFFLIKFGRRKEIVKSVSIKTPKCFTFSTVAMMDRV